MNEDEEYYVIQEKCQKKKSKEIGELLRSKGAHIYEIGII